jgi:hypothetical protein
MKLIDEVFPTFWPLRSTGEDNYQHIYRQVKFINIFMVITVLSSFSTSTAGLPWYGDEYEIMLPVKVFTDCLGKKAPPFLALFYLSVYHVGFTMMACGFILIHFVFHLKYQYFLLNKRLQQLSDGPKNWNVEECIDSKQYQHHVKEELTLCIQYHQNLLSYVSKSFSLSYIIDDFRIVSRFNEFIYYPIFLITTSSILFSVSLIFYLVSLTITVELTLREFFRKTLTIHY